MGLINYSNIEDGTTIDAADVNTPLTTIYNDYNGNIDSNNLADNAVTTAKIGDGAVTNAKLSTTAGELGGAWVSFTPNVYFGTIGNGTVTGKYSKSGKNVKGFIEFTLGSTSVINATGFGFQHPVLSAYSPNSGNSHGFCTAVDSSDSNKAYCGTLQVSSDDRLRPQFYSVSGTYITKTTITSSIPFTWTTGDSLYIYFEYEAA